MPAAPTAPVEPPPSEVARNAFILRNFDETLIRDKTVQSQILFGRRMDRLAKPAPRPVCVITAHPARYRDPGTGLPYFNAYAYREIQRLRRGEYKWSSLLGAWVGSCTYAARGVPERFLKGGKPKEPKEKESEKESEKEKEEKEMDKETANPTNGEVADKKEPEVDKATPIVQEGEKEKPMPNMDSTTVPTPSPLALPQPKPPQPPGEAQTPDQGPKPADAEPALQPATAPVVTPV